MEPFRYFPGTIPLVVSVPHCGTHVPASILERFTPEAKALPDTDWHVDRLYDFVRGMGAHLITATHSRYVADLNRRPDGESLYPGQFTTGLCPLTMFDGTPLYREGQEPDVAEVEARRVAYWQPYHTQLQEVLDGLRQRAQRVILFDAHSIASQVPALFEGELPDLNFGTNSGATADAALVEWLMHCCDNSRYSTVLNGRFKGGYITRHYGRPEEGVEAIQLELAQKNYMNEGPPYRYNDARATQLQMLLRQLIGVLALQVSK